MTRTWRVATILALTSSAVSLRAQQQAPTFAARTDAVRVDVLVSRHGAAVTGLGPDDFELRDNGVLQHVDLVSVERIPLNLVLALDVSASVSGERLARLRRAAAGVLKDLGPADQAALVTFGDAVAVHGRLTHDVPAIDSALSLAHAEGRTALRDAVYAAIVVAEADVGRSLVLVFSDGADTLSWLTPDQLLQTARKSDAVVYGVTVHDSGALLRELGRTTGGSVVDVASMANVENAFRTVLDEFRHRYLVSYTPTGVASGGWHTLTVKVKKRSDDVRVVAHPGYPGSNE